jgi:hypothetical protein
MEMLEKKKKDDDRTMMTNDDKTRGALRRNERVTNDKATSKRGPVVRPSRSWWRDDRPTGSGRTNERPNETKRIRAERLSRPHPDLVQPSDPPVWPDGGDDDDEKKSNINAGPRNALEKKGRRAMRKNAGRPAGRGACLKLRAALTTNEAMRACVCSDI